MFLFSRMEVLPPFSASFQKCVEYSATTLKFWLQNLMQWFYAPGQCRSRWISWSWLGCVLDKKNSVELFWCLGFGACDVTRLTSQRYPQWKIENYAIDRYSHTCLVSRVIICRLNWTLPAAYWLSNVWDCNQRARKSLLLVFIVSNKALSGGDSDCSGRRFDNISTNRSLCVAPYHFKAEIRRESLDSNYRGQMETFALQAKRGLINAIVKQQQRMVGAS